MFTHIQFIHTYGLLCHYGLGKKNSMTQFYTHEKNFPPLITVCKDL